MRYWSEYYYSLFITSVQVWWKTASFNITKIFKKFERILRGLPLWIQTLVPNARASKQEFCEAKLLK
jgi:hypothetical protein